MVCVCARARVCVCVLHIYTITYIHIKKKRKDICTCIRYIYIYIYTHMRARARIHTHRHAHTHTHTPGTRVYRQAEYPPPRRSIWWTDAPTPSRGRPTRFTKFRPSLDSGGLFFSADVGPAERMAPRWLGSISDVGWSRIHRKRINCSRSFFLPW